MKPALCVALLTAILVAAAQQAPQGAGAARGGGFGGAIVLGPDDKPAFPDPPAGFNVKRDNIPHAEMMDVQADPKAARSICCCPGSRWGSPSLTWSIA